MHAPRFRPALEPLECRFNPAGTVTASFADGTWTLTGDADANDIAIAPNLMHDFTISGRNGTEVVGVTELNDVQNIVIKLGAGNDKVEFREGLAGVFVPGNVTINGGHGDNTVAITFALIGKSLSIRNGNGFDSITLQNSLVAGDVVIQNGAGGSAVETKRDSIDYVSAIGGSLRITNGAGADNTAISDTNIAGNVIVHNSLPQANGHAGTFVVFNAMNQTSRSIIGGNVSVRYLGGSSSAVILDAEVLGNVILDSGNGSAEVHFDGNNVLLPVHIQGNLTVMGQGDTFVGVGNLAETGLIVDRNLTITGGGGEDVISAYRLQVGGATRIRTGGGSDAIDIDDSTFAGPAQIQTGAGADHVRLERRDTTSFSTRFAGDLKLNLGADDDELLTAVFGDPACVVELLGKGYLSGGGGNNTWYGAEFVAPFYPVDMVFFET